MPEQWSGDVERRAARDDGSPLDIVLGTAADLVAAGAGSEIWRSPSVRRPARVVERLAWGPAPPAVVEPPSLVTITRSASSGTSNSRISNLRKPVWTTCGATKLDRVHPPGSHFVVPQPVVGHE